MPEYRIVSEVDSGPDHRSPRGERLRLDEARLVTVIDAEDFQDAVYRSSFIEPRHTWRRIVSVEELHPGFSFTDEEITAALTSPADPFGEVNRAPMVDPADFAADEASYGSGDFIWTVHAVAEALRESGLVPGLHLSLLHSDQGVDYSMVEVHDDARGTYLSRGSELQRLTDDRAATGWTGVLAIARALIGLSNDLH